MGDRLCLPFFFVYTRSHTFFKVSRPLYHSKVEDTHALQLKLLAQECKLNHTQRDSVFYVPATLYTVVEYVYGTDMALNGNILRFLSQRTQW
jgi:hypothetical protein